MEESSLPSQDLTGSAHKATVVSNAPQCSESGAKVDPGASEDDENSLKFADELMEKGVKASKAHDYAEAVDFFSRALEIRVAHYGELSPECVNAFYKYGCALLYKAQEEADPFAAIPKKDAESLQDSDKNGSIKNVVTGETSVASASSTAAEEKNSNQEGSVAENASDGKDEADEGEESDNEDEGDEDDSDLDLAWKMLDLARAIAEKNPVDTMEKVDILSSLAEVALEREDLETSLSDYHKALAILEQIAEPDSRYIAELNFRICLCFELGCKASEATPYCQKAISICKSRMQRLTEEVKSMPEVVPTLVAPEGANLPSDGVGSGNAVSKKEAEIETLSNLLSELEKKLEDLQQLVMNPTSILSDILGLMSAKAGHSDKAAPAPAGNSSVSGAARNEAPTMSTTHTNGTPEVTNLGVVGRGIKRVTPVSCSEESNPAKRPALEPSADQGDGNAA